jgi:hypothetical protein
MEVTQRGPRGHLDGVPLGGEPDLSLAGGRENVIIENLTAFATAGVQGVCGVCWADVAVPPSPGRSEHRNSAWASPTAA